jgi:hypothetical protein
MSPLLPSGPSLIDVIGSSTLPVVPDSTAPPTPREWLAIVLLSILTVLAYATLPVFWGG